MQFAPTVYQPSEFIKEKKSLFELCKFASLS